MNFQLFLYKFWFYLKKIKKKMSGLLVFLKVKEESVLGLLVFF
jgi:hypothetical protein